MRSFARFISLAFHPVIFTLFTPFLVVYRESWNLWYSIRWTLFTTGFLILALFIFYLMRPKEFFSDFDIYKREQRVAFYTIGCIMAVLYFIVAVYFKGFFFSLSALSLGILIGLVLLEVINFYIKASIHVAVACSFVVTMGVLYGGMIFLAIWWLAPLVAWSRYALKKHTLPEITAGALFGGFVTGLTFFIGKLLLS